MRIIKYLSNILMGVFIIVMIWGVALQVMEEKNTAWNIYFNLGYAILSFLAAAISLYGSGMEHITGNSQKGLIFLGLGNILFGLGLVVWTYLDITQGTEIPFPSLSDLFFVLFYAMIAFSVYYFIKIFSVFVTRKQITEFIFLFAGLTTTIFYFFIDPDTSSDLSKTARFLNILYPVLGIASAGGAFLITRVGGGIIRKNAEILALGLLLHGLAELSFSYRTSNSLYWNGDITDILYAISAFILGIFAKHVISELTKETPLISVTTFTSPRN